MAGQEGARTEGVIVAIGRGPTHLPHQQHRLACRGPQRPDEVNHRSPDQRRALALHLPCNNPALFSKHAAPNRTVLHATSHLDASTSHRRVLHL